MARAGTSLPARFCDHPTPPSRVRKIPPRVVPTNMTRGFARAISIAEIGDPSNAGDAAFHVAPSSFVCHRRAEPAQSCLGPLLVAGSIAMTVKERWFASPADIIFGLI